MMNVQTTGSKYSQFRTRLSIARNVKIDDHDDEVDDLASSCVMIQNAMDYLDKVPDPLAKFWKDALEVVKDSILGTPGENDPISPSTPPIPVVTKAKADPSIGLPDVKSSSPRIFCGSAFYYHGWD